MTFKRVLVSSFMLVCNTWIVAQNPQADSIRRLLDNSALSTRERVDILNDLSYELFDVDDSAALVAALTALELASEDNYKEGIKSAYTFIGLGYNSIGEFRKGLHYFILSSRVEAPGTEDKTAYNLVLIGNTYRDLAFYDSAQFYYDAALLTLGEKGDPAYIARVYKSLATLDLYLWNNQEALAHLAKAEDFLNKSSGDVYQEADILSLYGVAYENLLDYATAQTYFNKMCELATSRNYPFHKIKCLLNKADLAARRGDFIDALPHCFAALKLTEEYSFPPQVVATYLKTGEVYSELSQYPLAFKYLLEALKISERLGLRYETARIYGNISWIHKSQLNFPLALDYIDKSQKIREEIGDRQGLSNSQNIRGLIFYQQKKYDQALDEFEKSIQIRREIGHRQGVAASLFNSSLVYQDLNQLDKTYELQLRSLAIDKTVDDKYSLFIDYNTLASLMITMDRMTEAEKYMKEADELAHQTQSQLLLRNSLAVFASFYEKKKDYKRAFEYQKRYQELNDSIYSKENSVKLAELQAFYQIEQKEQQIKLLSQEKQIQDDQIDLQKSRISLQYSFIIFVSVALLLVSILAFFIYRYNRQIKKAHIEILEQQEEITAQSEELTEANQTIAQINRNLEQKVEDRTSALTQAYKELDTFFYRSSHDFRRPLTTFMGLAEVAKVTVKDSNALELFEKVKETAQNLDKMLIKLQSISDVGAQQLIYKEVFLRQIFDGICDGFSYELEQRNIKIQFESLLSKPFVSYPAMVKIIIENLVENAIHFCTRRDPYIHVKAFDSVDRVVLEVSDNGQGIDPQYHSRIFDMYFRGNERSKGNGLGLYIVKKAVGKLHGSIEFESTPVTGSVFRVFLPLDMEHTSDQLF